METKTIASRISNLSVRDIISEYIADISIMNKLTAKEYHARLNAFKVFVKNKYSQRVEDILSKIRENKQDPYSLLTEYARYLGTQKISTLTLKQRVVTMKNFLVP